ncbi:MAG TPA: hypothetical protein VGG64_22845 [Pirellulales bacterium]
MFPRTLRQVYYPAASQRGYFDGANGPLQHRLVLDSHVTIPTRSMHSVPNYCDYSDNRERFTDVNGYS